MIEVRPITLEEMEAVKKACLQDEHALLAPTHLIQKGEELMGCFSIAAIPLVVPWFHTKKCKNFDSVHAMKIVENALRVAGHRYVAVPVHDTSPFAPLMKTAGFCPIDDNKLYMKVL